MPGSFLSGPRRLFAGRFHPLDSVVGFDLSHTTFTYYSGGRLLSAFGRAFRTPDLRRKLLFTLGIITIFRLGAFIPSPGVSYQNVQQCLQNGQTSGGIYQLVNLFSGGALLQVSICPPASCPTSLPASSSSCSGWSFPDSSSCMKRARPASRS